MISTLSNHKIEQNTRIPLAVSILFSYCHQYIKTIVIVPTNGCLTNICDDVTQIYQATNQITPGLHDIPPPAVRAMQQDP